MNVRAELWQAHPLDLLDWSSSPGDGCEHLQDELDDDLLPPTSILELRVPLSRQASADKEVGSWTSEAIKSLPNVSLKILSQHHARFEARGAGSTA